MKKIILLMAMALGLSFQSCKEMGLDPWSKDKKNNDTTTTNTLAFDKLVGTQWKLVSIENNSRNTEIKVDSKYEISLNINTPTQGAGTNVCNKYSTDIKAGANNAITFSNIISSEIFCNADGIDNTYMAYLRTSVSFTASSTELRIVCNATAPGKPIVLNTLVFAPYKSNPDPNGNDSALALNIKMLSGRTFTLHSFVDAGVEVLMPDGKNCYLTMLYSNSNKWTAALQADCNSGGADVTFNSTYDAIQFSNIVLTKMACQNQATADRFIEFLRHTSGYAYSDYGTTLTIWSLLTTFAESKMVLKIAEEPTTSKRVEILDTPPVGLPKSTYPSFNLTNLIFDGKDLQIKYNYNGKAPDYKISAYSKFEITLSNPPIFVINLVTDGSQNTYSIITEDDATISLDAVRARITIGTPGTVPMKAIVNWEGKQIGTIDVLF